MTPQPGATGTKLLLIGLDGADRELVEAWADDGRLPTLQRLRRAGVSGPLAAPIGLSDDAAWSSFSTGVGPGRHARFHHRRVRVPPNDLVNHGREAMSQPPFWDQLEEQGLRIAVVDVPKSPMGVGTTSVVVADWMSHENEARVIALSEAAKAHPLAGRFVPDPTFVCGAMDRDETSTRAFEHRLVQRAARRSEALLELLKSQRWDLFVGVFAETHCVGHECWHDHDPDHPGHDPARVVAVGDVVEHVYRDVDARLAELVAAAGDDATVIAFSLLGMGPNHSGEHLLDTILRRIESGSGQPVPATLRLVDRLRRRIPRSVRRRAPQAMRDAARQAKDATVNARRYWVVPTAPTNLPATAIRINVVGRDPMGTVSPGPEFEAACDELRRELLELRDPSTDRPLVREVVFTREAHAGPQSDAFADVLVRWEEAGPIRAATSPKVGTVRGEPPKQRSGGHRDGGWFVAAGPGIEPGRLERPAAVVDLAPTVAGLLGASLDDTDGTPIPALEATVPT